MSLSTLPLSYCTNVHPGKTVEEIASGLTSFTIPARQQLGERIAAGLWLPASAISQIEEDSSKISQLQDVLNEGELVCYTLNTFPYGNFHSERVKEQVYLPDWTTQERLDYTISCANVLSELMPDGTEGSLSTVPLGFKGFERPSDFDGQCIQKLLQLAEHLDRLHDETGKVIRLAIEPEPLCVLETTPETIQFFEKLFTQAESQGLDQIARRHLGVCYDVCHQAVEFEDTAKSIEDLTAKGIRINKVHITCAIDVKSPWERPAAREQLKQFVEQRYLHQSFARSASGIVSVTDLSADLCDNPPEDFQNADAWRIHFHVPVDAEAIGELGTTRPDLEKALSAVAKLDYAPHLEVETYTWNVLPGERDIPLVEGLVGELRATRELLKRIGSD
ncbi:metabolite traffic protein EboE [Thalassoglobus sp. JC818]|uniref:metabolite traffic protein EboE n=1 Tax=Thalassoglobus sp. JC818 TaxID=3232136 RepID=UPI0034586408